MRKLTYLAVFEPAEDGAYSVYFPDLPGCVSWGADFETAVSEAQGGTRWGCIFTEWKKTAKRCRPLLKARNRPGYRAGLSRQPYICISGIGC